MRRSLLVNYVVSYLGVAILSCALIGVLLFSQSYQELVVASFDNAKERAERALADLDAQIAICDDIALDIATRMLYAPSYFERNKYYETELLEHFARYRSYSSLTDDYFLAYFGRDLVFRTEVRSSSWNVVGQEYLRASGEAMRALIEGVSESAMRAGDSALLYMLPVRTTGRLNPQGDATLVFYLPKARIAQRLQDVSGGLPGECALYWHGEEVLCLGNAPAGRAHEAQLRFGDLLLTMRADEGQLLLRADWLERMNWTLLVLSLLLSSSVAGVVAYRKYRPIRRIASKYALPGEAPQNELSKLDRLLMQSREKDERQIRAIGEQMALLKHQSLKLLLTGNDAPALGERLDVFGVSLPGPYFAVFVVALPACATDVRALSALIEDLSDDGMIFHCSPDEKPTVVVSLAERGQYRDAADLIDAVLAAKARDYALHESKRVGMVEDIRDLHLAHLEALNESEAMGGDEPAEALDARHFESRALGRMLAALRAGDVDDALMHLERFCNEVERQAHSSMIRRYILSDALSATVRAMGEAGARVPPAAAARVLGAVDPRAFCAAVRALITGSAASLMRAEDAREGDLGARVVAYMQAHFHEYDLSLDVLSEAFDLSAGHLSRLVKQTVHLSYKEYLIHLRIERAKVLLADEHKSLTETSEQIGYANISHFIKIFKSLTGTTPAKYRKSGAD